jgi:ATP adenylyltransferase
MPTPLFERSTLNERGDDVFKPPYNPNLYVGELRDEDEGTEYVVLVSEFWLFLLFGKPSP